MQMIYFDNAATTRVNLEVLKTFNDLHSKFFANSASTHKLGKEVYRLEEMARNQISSLLKCESSEIIFTSGATESNNLAIKGIAFQYQNRGKHLITTKVEHPSVLNAFKSLEEDFGFSVTYLDVNEKGVISLEELKNSLRNDTILVSIMSVNNEVGSINPIEEIGKLLKPYPKIVFHTDATQSIGKIQIDYKDVDLLSMSSHKIHGFKGSGLLLKRKHLDLLPLLSGGGQEFNYRSGTNNYIYEVCLAKTLRLALEKQLINFDYVKNINLYCREKLSNLNVKINSPIDGSPFILSLSLNKKASVVSEALSLEDIYVSTKSACSSKKSPTSYVLLAMHKDINDATNAIRLSFSEENTKEEIDVFVNSLTKILNNIK